MPVPSWPQPLGFYRTGGPLLISYRVELCPASHARLMDHVRNLSAPRFACLVRMGSRPDCRHTTTSIAPHLVAHFRRPRVLHRALCAVLSLLPLPCIPATHRLSLHLVVSEAPIALLISVLVPSRHECGRYSAAVANAPVIGTSEQLARCAI